jgi:UDP-N-acetyl-D-mannosaminuronic acid dehydrogenase
MMQRNMKPVKVLIIGLGRLGLPVAKYVKEKGFEVFGFDANVLHQGMSSSVSGYASDHARSNGSRSCNRK